MTADPSKTQISTEFKYDAPFLCCLFDPTGRFLYAGAQDNTVQRWEMDSGARTRLAGHRSWVRSLAFAGDGDVLLTAGYEGRLNWWHGADESPKPFRSVQAHQGWIRAIAVSGDGTLIATVGNDKFVRLWSTDRGELIHELAGHQDHVYNVAFDPSGEWVVSADLKLVVRQWRVANGEQVRCLEPASLLHKYDKDMQCNLGGARSLKFHPDGNELLLGGIVVVATNIFDGGAGSKPTAVVVDWQTGERKMLHRPQQPLPAVLWGLEFHPHGFWVGATGGAIGGHLLFWNRDEENDFFQFKLPSPGRDLALHVDQVRLAIPHYDNHVRVYAMA